MFKTHYEKVKYVIENSSDEQLRDIGIDQKTIPYERSFKL